MQKTTKILLAVFILLVILKIILGLFITFPLGFADNYIYLKMANSFINTGSFFFDNVEYTLYPPGYSVLISPAFLADNFTVTFFIIKIINALISSTVIFASYLLARTLFDRKKSVLISILISFFPPIFTIAFYPLSENLFYPLTLFGFYFFYKSIKENDLLWDFLTAITLGLLYLTRMSAVFMIALICLVAVYFLFKKDYKQFFKKIGTLLLSMLVVLPWLFRNVSTYGFTLGGLLGRYEKTIGSVNNNLTLSLFSQWFVYNITYIAVAVGVILFIALVVFALLKKENKLFFNLSLTFLIIYFFSYTVYTASVYKPMGRYFVPVIPLLLILGFYSLLNLKLSKKAVLITSIIFSVIFTASFWLSQYSLFPINNMELTFFGAMNYALSYLGINNPYLFIPLFLVLPFSFLLIKKLKPLTIISLVFVFFIITNVLNYAVLIQDINTRWEPLETAELSEWINNNIDINQIIYIDERDHMFDKDGFIRTETNERYDETLLVTTMLINHNLQSVNIEDIDEGYLLSSYELDYPVIKKINQGYLYLIPSM